METVMKSKLTALFSIAIFSSTMFAQESRPLVVTVPEGTQIAARLANQLDSGQVRVGDAVTMDVLEDLKIQNAVVIPHGSIVMGHVTEAKGARKMGRGGRIEISFETVTAADGTRVPVSGERSEKGKGGYGGGSLVGAGAAGLFFPPAAALLLLKHGHASVIPAGTILTVHVTSDTSVAGTLAKEIPPAVQLPAVQPSQAQVNSIAATQPESLGDASRRLKAQRVADGQVVPVRHDDGFISR